MKIEKQNDAAILAELGDRFTQARLDHNLTQEALATAAAVSKSTVERLETGRSVQLSTLIRILSALDLAKNLEVLVPPAGPRPLELLKHRGKGRRRASSKQSSAKPWTWDDEK